MNLSLSRRLTALLLAVLLLICTVNAALAESTAATYTSTQSFLDYLDSENIKYSYDGMNDSNLERVTVTYSMDTFDSLDCVLFFDEDQVSLRIWNIITATAGQNYIMNTINDLNYSYKYAKFVYDTSDSTVQVELDMYIDPETCGEPVCKEMIQLFRVLNNETIADKIQSLQ